MENRPELVKAENAKLINDIIKHMDLISETTNTELKKFVNDFKVFLENPEMTKIKELIEKGAYPNTLGTKAEPKSKNILMLCLGKIVKDFDFGSPTQENRENFILKVASNLAYTKGFLGSVDYSTLQHSTNVAKIVANKLVQMPEYSNLSAEIQKKVVLKALLHDAIEAVGIGDIPTPIKQQFSEIYQIEDELTEKIDKFLGIENTDENIIKLINKADSIERGTFMKLYFFNENFLARAVEIFSNQHKNEADLGNKLFDDLKRYYNNEPLQNELTNDFLKAFRLNYRENPNHLSEQDIVDYNLDLRIGLSADEVIKEFSKTLQGLGFDNITYERLMDTYKRAGIGEIDYSKLNENSYISPVAIEKARNVYNGNKEFATKEISFVVPCPREEENNKIKL